MKVRHRLGTLGGMFLNPRKSRSEVQLEALQSERIHLASLVAQACFFLKKLPVLLGEYFCGDMALFKFN